MFTFPVLFTGIHMDPIATQEGNYRVYMVVIPNVPVAVIRKIVSQLDICGVKTDMENCICTFHNQIIIKRMFLLRDMAPMVLVSEQALFNLRKATGIR
jgi:hypothetical protein